MSISYLRTPPTAERAAQRAHKRLTSQPRRMRPRYFVLGALIVLIAIAGAGAWIFSSASASLSADGAALAKIGMPLGGGKIESVTVTGPHGKRIPVELRSDPQIWPKKVLPAHERVSITVVIKRPGWISWLAGKTERLHMTMVTPSASLVHHYMTLKPGQPLKLQFKQPVAVLWYGPQGQVRRHALAKPSSTISIARSAVAGTLEVKAALRSWESAKPAVISWFPAGGGASAVASPAPGTQVRPNSPITLTFNKPVARALGGAKPAISPATSGTWETINSHTIRFQPTGYGYGLATPVSVGLPSNVRLVGGEVNGSAMTGRWTVPAGSTTRLQELLSFTGYLPFNINYAGKGVPLTSIAQEDAAIKPPQATFSWKYPDVPSALKGEWQPGSAGVMTRGALMAFENAHDMTADGVAGPAVWKALINDVVTGHKSTFGYTFVSVSEGSPESLSLWHNGKTVMTTAVNTGIPAAPTATGIYPVFEHLPVTTMTGTNPDGSHYSDPGIPWVSYFNGGDALHGFLRASYGSPQSLGCVEMPYATAGQVYPYTPIGTLVDVS